MDLAKNLFYSQRALNTLFSVTNKLQMQGDRYLEDITIRQMLAIPAIIHAPRGQATINHIARQLGTTKQSAKQIVDAMEKKKYLSVEPSDQDKRAVNVTITDEGKTAFGICSGRTDEFLADIFAEFTTAELETLCALLQKLYCFDGVQKEGFDSRHMEYDPGNADIVMQYHQSFVKRRTRKDE